MNKSWRESLQLFWIERTGIGYSLFIILVGIPVYYLRYLDTEIEQLNAFVKSGQVIGTDYGNRVKLFIQLADGKYVYVSKPANIYVPLETTICVLKKRKFYGNVQYKFKSRNKCITKVAT